jgi:hypothetical protein
MLPMSLDCPFLIAPSVFSSVYSVVGVIVVEVTSIVQSVPIRLSPLKHQLSTSIYIYDIVNITSRGKTVLSIFEN